MKPLNIKKILVPTDFSVPSRQAINPAVEIAKRTGAGITLVHVMGIMPYASAPFYSGIPSSPAYIKDVTDSIKKQLAEMAMKMEKKGVKNIKTEVLNGSAHREIVRYSSANKIDLIVMGTHGVSGFREFFLGSNTARVLSHAECPVLSVQKHFTQTDFKHIIVPFRDKKHSREKIDYAIWLAKLYDATLHILGVDTEGTKAHHKKMMLEAEQIERIAGHSDVKTKIKVITHEYVGDTVLKYAKQNKADLIIVTADMDKVSISEYFMGPFAQQIVNHSPIPVLSIHPTFNTDTIDLRFY